MENHPIPQDVTGFQFKLIGNMTVKQFAYLATGIVFAWILFQLPINILIKFPFCAFFALFGTALAYFPVSGRPMDIMIGNYIKALFRPTQFVYEKIGGQIYFPNKMPLPIRNIKQYKNDFSPFPKDQLKAYLGTLDAQPKNKVDEKENSFLMSVSGLAANTPYQPQPTLQVNPIMANNQSSQPQGSPSVKTTPPLEPVKEAVPHFIATPKSPSPKPQRKESLPPIVSAEPEIKQDISPIEAVEAEVSVSEQIKAAKLMPRKIKTIGTPIVPDSPNLITGITKDARGNALPNILVEVKDKDGNSVRAFKTNELGRFASATPLINGTYTIEFEDPKAQNKFEKTTINVADQIISPLEVISIDTREELRRSLFSTNTR